jgi:hypothetical protein
MKTFEILTEGLDPSRATEIIRAFLQFAKKELGLSQLPKIRVHSDPSHSIEHKSFGGYSNGGINITISNRHINDVLRTLAHELIHYVQDLENRILPDSGADGSPIENEANSKAAVLMRKWGSLHPTSFALMAID